RPRARHTFLPERGREERYLQRSRPRAPAFRQGYFSRTQANARIAGSEGFQEVGFLRAVAGLPWLKRSCCDTLHSRDRYRVRTGWPRDADLIAEGADGPSVHRRPPRSGEV